MVDFLLVLKRETTFVTFLLPVHQAPSKDRSSLKEKNLFFRKTPQEQILSF